MTTRAIDALDDVYPREHEFRFTKSGAGAPELQRGKHPKRGNTRPVEQEGNDTPSVEQERLLLQSGAGAPELQRGNKTPNYRGE